MRITVLIPAGIKHSPSVMPRRALGTTSPPVTSHIISDASAIHPPTAQQNGTMLRTVFSSEV